MSALALNLWTLTSKVPIVEAAGEVILARGMLQTAIEALDADPCWLALKSGPVGEEAEQWTLHRLADYGCVSRSGATTDAPPPSTTPGAPAAPTMVRLIAPLHPAQLIAENVRTLADSKLLGLARQAGPHLDLAIYRWEYLRIQLEAQRPGSTATAPPAENSVLPERRGALSRDDADQEWAAEAPERLTLADVRVLSAYAPLSWADLDALQRPFQSISVPQIGLTGVTFGSASLFCQILLWLSAMWFWLNQRELHLGHPESTQSPSVFQMFGRTRISRVVLKLLICVPPICALLLASSAVVFAATHWVL